MSEDTQQPTRAAVSIVVTRADGTVEDLGVVSFDSKHPHENVWYRARKALGLRVDQSEVIHNQEL